MEHFNGAFAKFSAQELFKTVNVRHNGIISKEEWIFFWMVVKACGNSEEEIITELQNIKNGENFGGFVDLPKKFHHHSSK